MAGRTFINGKEILAAEDLTLTDDLIVGDDATFTDDVDIGGTLTLSTDGKITTTANGDLTLLPHGTGITIVGDAGSALKLGTPTNDDMFVSGRHETRGTSFVTSTATAVSTEFGSKTHDGDDVIHSVGKGGHVFKADAQKARGTMTLTGIPVADETFVINATTITFKADGSGDIDHCTIGGTAAATVTNIVATLAECTEAANLTAWDGAGDTVVVEWGTAGVAGNAIVWTEAATNVAVDGAGTLGTTHAGIAAATLLDIDESKAVETYGTITAGSAVILPANQALRSASPANYGGFYPYNSQQTVDCNLISVGTVSNYLLVCQQGDVTFDFQFAQQTNPTLFIVSANQATDEWVSFAHNQTDGVIDCGSGTLQLNPGGTATMGDGGTTNYAQFAADGELTLAGTARVKKNVILPVQDLSVGGTAPDQTIIENFIGYSYDIADDSVFTFAVPNDWASGTDIAVGIHWYINEAYATNNGEVNWQAAYSLCATNASEAVDNCTEGSITSGDINIPATAKYLTTTDIGDIPNASIAAGDEIGVTLERIALVGGADPTADPVVVHVHLEYTADKLGTAT
jgi:hypothetical protein